jgi:hypothetical protein
VLLPLDKRKGLTVRNGEVSPTIRGSEISQPPARKASEEISPEVFYPVVGFLGPSSKGSFFLHWPSHFSPPDIPRLIFYMDDLKKTVQRALADHLHEAELEAIVAAFSQPQEQPLDEEIEADYALGCSIDEFSLLTLFYRVQPRNSEHFYPVLGPSWAKVTLTLTLYRWPSGEQLWQGSIGENMTDPLPGDDTRLYGSLGQVMSVALSRAVGSFLIAQEVQNILFH